jgi:epoxyqueuosine reductase
MSIRSKKMNSKMLKSLAMKAGVDLCGIAPVERFEEAPEGFRPTDIYPSAESVFVFAKRVPQAALLSRSLVPYKFTCDVVLDEVFRITCDLSLRLQDLGVAAGHYGKEHTSDQQQTGKQNHSGCPAVECFAEG